MGTPTTDFNPRAYTRHDSTRLRRGAAGQGFQSTCLHEARRLRGDVHGDGGDFNPRAYTRHDGGDDFMVGQWILFQSTCLHEARLRITGWRARANRFQSTCLHEARHARCGGRRRQRRFQSTCLHEARPWSRTGFQPTGYFNPRAYTRHDVTSCAVDMSILISIHVPTRGTTQTQAIDA